MKMRKFMAINVRSLMAKYANEVLTAYNHQGR